MSLIQPDLSLTQAIKSHAWLHFTQMKSIIESSAPVVIARGEGSKVWDTNGKEYIDGLAGPISSWLPGVSKVTAVELHRGPQ